MPVLKYPLTGDPRVTIAITTFRRESQLGALLATVQERIAELPPSVRVRTLVIDNDPAGSARAVVEAIGAEAPRGRTDYAHETRPGIAAARQRALDEAHGADAVVFLDDDCVPQEGWLPALIDAWQEHGADAVMGYVKYVWPPEASRWIVAGGFMRRDATPTGTSLSTFATGNVLVDMATVRRLGLHFDRSLGLSGGEDSLFGEQLVAAGGTIVACLESVAVDEVPVSRTTRDFARRRSISHGQVRVKLRLRAERGRLRRARVRVVSFFGGLLRLVAFYTLHLVGKVTRNVPRDAIGMRRAWYAWGMVQQSVGHATDEYAR